MTTYANGQFFHWGQKTSPVTPNTKGRGWTDITSYYARVKYRTILNEASTQLECVIVRRNDGVDQMPQGAVQVMTPKLSQRGFSPVSGYAYLSGSPARRVITIMTQPPRARIVSEFTTTQLAGTFSFPKLPAGTYMVIDSTEDGSRQALVYDWVVAA